MDNQKILRIVLSAAIVVAFFLPLSNMGDEISAWGLLTGSAKHSSQFSTAQLFTAVCLLVVFVCVITNLAMAVLRRKTSVFFNLLPLLAIIAIVVFTMSTAKENINETLQSFGTGFYIMFIGSFLLPFTSIAVTNPANA
jgi:uncharacterized membrane protein